MCACTLGRRTLPRVRACALLLRVALAVAGGAQALKEAGYVLPTEFLWDADPRAASAAAGARTGSASPPLDAAAERRSPDAESGPPAAAADSSGMAAPAADPAREAAARPEVLDAHTPGSSGAPEPRRSRSAYERTWRRQYVYVAATLPAEGKRCVANDLKRLQPDAVRTSNLSLPNEVLQSLALPALTCWRRCACNCACSSCNECRARCCAGVGQRTAAACGAARRAPCMAACRRGHLAQHLAGAEQAAVSGTAAAAGCLGLLRRCGLGR